MNPEEPINVHQLLSEERTFSEEEVALMDEAIAGRQCPEVRKEVGALEMQAEAADNASPATLQRLGISQYFLGRHQNAERYLSQVSDNAVASYFHALVLMVLNQYDQAEQKFLEAEQQGFDAVDCSLRRAGAIRAQDRVDEAEALLRSVATDGAGRAEYSFQMGCIWAQRGDMLTAIEYFERAVDMDPHHSGALFWLAAENCRHGNDDEAIRLYEQSLSKPPHYLGALLNLGLLYEDRDNYAAASYCFRRILEFDPNHGRARLYLKDIEATGEMYFDEDSARHEAKMEQLLTRPISDFELSVRSRNCLEAMFLFTLGDLTEISEQELLSGKNFGETSLHEIREMLTAHGLRIGLNLNQAKPRERVLDTQSLSPQEQSMMSKPVSELNLSVRARKCMMRLGIDTLGTLVQRSADELLSSRNFGVTSLNEVRGKLSEIDMKLRND